MIHRGQPLTASKTVTGWWRVAVLHRLEFSLLCGYHAESVAGEEAALEDVCRLHTSIETTRHFGALREAPRAARHFIADALRRSGASRTLVSDAQIVVTEFAANAVSHARSRFLVAVRTGAAVRIALRDASPVPPVRRNAAPKDGSRRGLELVDAVAPDGGVEITDAGKTRLGRTAPVNPRRRDRVRRVPP